MCQYVLEFQYIFRIDELTEFIMEFNCSYVLKFDDPTLWSYIASQAYSQAHFAIYLGLLQLLHRYTILYHYNVGSSHSLAITLALLQAVCSLSEKYTDTKPRHLF